jgi:hypothetical protein
LREGVVEVVIQVGRHDRTAEPASGVVPRSADPVVRVWALALAHQLASGPEHGALRRALGIELIGESHGSGRRNDALVALLWHTVDLFREGDPHAQRRLEELRHELAERDHRGIGAAVGAIEVMLAIRAGRLSEAEALAQACAEQGHRAGDVDTTGRHTTQLVAIRWYQGRLGELLPTLADPAATTDETHTAGLALAAATAGDRRTAAVTLARLRGDALARLPRNATWLTTMYGIVEAAHLLDDADTSAQAYELLQPFAHLPAVANLGVACFGSVRHALGVASLTTGHTDRAIEHFREAVEGNLALGHWPAVATSRRRYAQALTRRGRPNGTADANRELAAVHDVAPPCPPSEPAGSAVTCVRDGGHWRVGLGARSVVVRHNIGMLHLAVLLANPDTDVPAIELSAGVAALTAATSAARSSREPASEEHARLAVGKAIRRAITHVEQADARTADHLRRTVRTGRLCSYRPI